MKVNKILHFTLLSVLSLAGCAKENISPKKTVATSEVAVAVHFAHTYFTVERPPAFSVQKEGYGVYFSSPDTKIRFYAYGIQGEGEPLDKGQKIGYAPSPFEKKKENERLLSQREVVEPKKTKYIASRYSTYQTKDKHFRSFIATRECTEGASFGDFAPAVKTKCRYYTIGITYPSKKIFEQYKDAFMKFKDSFNMQGVSKSQKPMRP